MSTKGTKDIKRAKGARGPKMHAILVAFYGTKKQCRMLQQQVDALLGAFAAAQPITGQSSMSYSGQNAVFTVSMAAFADGNVWPDETKG